LARIISSKQSVTGLNNANKPLIQRAERLDTKEKAPGGAFVEEEKKEEKVCCLDRL
jgi:hypothetical protein